MKISVIIAHPNKNSFNHGIAHAVISELQKNQHQVIFHDLYEEKFDPILPSDEIARDAALDSVIGEHCNEIASADGIVIIHPNWWGQPPAILKGWIDRVFRPGVAYEFLEGDKGEGIPVGLLKAKAAIIFNTSNTPFQREKELFGDPLEILWKTCIFDLCGVTNFYRKMFGVIVTSDLAQRKAWLKEAQETVNQYFCQV